MNLNQFVASNLRHVNKATDFEFVDADEAYGQAEMFTNLGFEATVTRMDDVFIVRIEP